MLKQIFTTLNQFSANASWPQSLALLAARFWMAKVFFMSGLVKIKSWDTTLALFADEYNVPLLPTDLAAYMATAGELTLPILLVFGLLTPLAAIGLFAMTLVIELFVYPGTTEHYYWMLILALIVTHGSGKIGADNLLQRYFARQA